MAWFVPHKRRTAGCWIASRSGGELYPLRQSTDSRSSESPPAAIVDLVFPHRSSPPSGCTMRRIASLVLLVGSQCMARAAEPIPVDFSRDVLPVLSDYCFQCHVPDANARKAKLRFDDKNS